MLRVLPPSQTEAFASEHDAAILACLAKLLGNSEPAAFDESQTGRAHLPLRLGGLGLRAATCLRFAAHWASWADSLNILRARLPTVAATVLHHLTSVDIAQMLPCLQAAAQSALLLNRAAFATPTW